ncbi:MAG: hypothetical protein ACRDJN_23330 [Chloroflexota bacterium]
MLPAQRPISALGPPFDAARTAVPIALLEDVSPDAAFSDWVASSLHEVLRGAALAVIGCAGPEFPPWRRP